MRWTRLFMGSLVAASLIAAAVPAAAHTDSGTDPEGDSTAPEGAYDISFTARSINEWRERRYLRIKVRTHEADFWSGSYLFIDVKLDARRGREADAVLHMWILDMSGSGCELNTRGGHRLRRGRFRMVGEPSGDDPEFYAGVSCRVRAHPLHATKRIRWKVKVIYADIGPVWDKAPGEGMYR